MFQNIIIIRVFYTVLYRIRVSEENVVKRYKSMSLCASVFVVEVLREEVIMKWYKDGHSSKGKSVFLYVYPVCTYRYVYFVVEVLREEVIMKWYKDGHSSKGKSVFLYVLYVYHVWLLCSGGTARGGDNEVVQGRPLQQGKEHLPVCVCAVYVHVDMFTL